MRFLSALLALTAASPAVAATVAVQVRDAKGQPVRDAVVVLHLNGRPTPAPPPGRGVAIAQHNIQFDPFVTVVAVNTSIIFPNRDAVRHHVYSFSPAKKFELKLYGHTESPSVHFDKAGIVALGCNIHDQMTAFVDVVDTLWAAKTDAQGNVRLNALPGGLVTIDVWHPYLRAPGNRVARTVQIGENGTFAQGFAITLRPPPPVTDSAY